MAENCFVGIFMAIDRNVSSRQASESTSKQIKLVQHFVWLRNPIGSTCLYSIQKMTEFDETFRSFTFWMCILSNSFVCHVAWGRVSKVPMRQATWKAKFVIILKIVWECETSWDVCWLHSWGILREQKYVRAFDYDEVWG